MAIEVAGLAVVPDLRDVSRDRAPAFDLTGVVSGSSAHVVAAIPLEPAARILWMNPALAPPFAQRLRGVHAEKVEPRIVPLGTEFRACEPARGKLPAAIGHVLATEDAELEHLLRREIGSESRIEIAADGRGPVIDVPMLHPIVHDDANIRHDRTATTAGSSGRQETPPGSPESPAGLPHRW